MSAYTLSIPVPLIGGRISNEKAVLSVDFIKSITLIKPILYNILQSVILAKIRKILNFQREARLFFIKIAPHACFYFAAKSPGSCEKRFHPFRKSAGCRCHAMTVRMKRAAGSDLRADQSRNRIADTPCGCNRAHILVHASAAHREGRIAQQHPALLAFARREMEF